MEQTRGMLRYTLYSDGRFVDMFDFFGSWRDYKFYPDDTDLVYAVPDEYKRGKLELHVEVLEGFLAGWENRRDVTPFETVYKKQGVNLIFGNPLFTVAKL